MDVPAALQAYLLGWTALTAAALAAAARDRALGAELRAYARYLLIPWKVAVFVPAGIFVTFAGRFAWDDTWDEVSGGSMAALTFLTAPWAVATASMWAMGLRPPRRLFLAAVACLFSASWVYDGWLLVRDGAYTPMWWLNLMVSPFLYIAAGILWNLEADARGRVTLGFLRADWPAPPSVRQAGRRLAAAVGLPVAYGAAFLLLSVRWHLPW